MRRGLSAAAVAGFLMSTGVVLGSGAGEPRTDAGDGVEVASVDSTATIPTRCKEWSDSPAKPIKGSPGDALLDQLGVLRRAKRKSDRFPDGIDWVPGASCFYGRHVRVLRTIRRRRGDRPPRLFVMVPIIQPEGRREPPATKKSVPAIKLAETWGRRKFVGPPSGSCCYTADRLSEGVGGASLEGDHSSSFQGLVPDQVAAVEVRAKKHRKRDQVRNNAYVVHLPVMPWADHTVIWFDSMGREIKRFVH